MKSVSDFQLKDGTFRSFPATSEKSFYEIQIEYYPSRQMFAIVWNKNYFDNIVIVSA